MYYILDATDRDFEIVSGTQGFWFMNEAKKLGLSALYQLFAEGWSDSKEELIKEIESVEWTLEAEYNLVAENLLESIKKAEFPIIIPSA